MLHRTGVVTATFALAWLVLTGAADAQIVTGTILGSVIDESKSVLPGVTATITSPVLSGGPQTIATDTKGQYRFAGLAPGTYTLTLTLQGFGTYSEELRVVTGATVERNVTLKVGAMAESITVTGESPMVDTRSAAVASTTTREVIENLPIIRTTVTDYVQATPGVSASSPGAYNEQIQVMGSPSNETTYVHDGVVINHVRTGNTWQGADIDSVEEINTVALGASVEWQSTAGGVVNVVTKSGTNKYEGDFTAYWKSNQLQSQSIKVDCNCPDGQTGFNLGKMRDESVHIGGPIMKDRLWFYSGFQHYAFTYAPPGTYPPEQPTSHWNRLPIKATWQINPTLKFSSLLHYEWWGGYSTGPTRSVTREAAQYYDTAHINSYGEEVNKTFGNATMLTVRAGGWWEPNQSYTAVTGDLVAPSHTDNFTGLVSQGVPSINRVIMRRDAQSAKMERYISGRRAQHSLRFGVQLERAHAVSQTAFPSGVQYYDFNGAPDYALFSEPSVQGAAFNTQGVWVEDQVTVGSRVTFTGGLRWDRMEGTSPSEQAVNNKLEDTGATIAGLGDMFTWHVASPRAGVNVKLTADGKSVVRATYGRAYRQILSTKSTSSIPESRSHSEELQRGHWRLYDARLRHQLQVESEDRSRPLGTESRHVFSRHRSATERSAGVQCELRAQGREQHHRLAGYRRHLRRSNNRAARRPHVARVPDSQFSQRASVPADEPARLFRFVQCVRDQCREAHVPSVAGPVEPDARQVRRAQADRDVGARSERRHQCHGPSQPDGSPGHVHRECRVRSPAR